MTDEISAQNFASDVQHIPNLEINAAVHSSNVQQLTKLCRRLKLEDSAMLDAIDNNGSAPIHIAVLKRNTELLGVLSSNGANLNAHDINGETPIIIAVKENAMDVLRFLIDECADVNLKSRDGRTPLQVATELQHADCISLLVDSGGRMYKKTAVPSANIDSSLAENSEKFLAGMLKVVSEYSSNNSKHSNGDLFFANVVAVINAYLNSNIDEVGVKNKIYSVFDQFIKNHHVELAHKDQLKVVRKIIGEVNSVMQTRWAVEDNTNLLKLMSRFESLVEEEMIKAASDMISKNAKRDLQYAAAEANSNNIAKSLVEISKEKILSKSASQNMKLQDFISIKAKPLEKLEHIKELFKICEKRFQEEVKQCLSNKQDLQTILGLIKEGLSSADEEKLCHIDKMLRYGKNYKMHILAFPEHKQDVLPNLVELCYQTGANIYTFNPSEDASSEDCLTYLGIAAVNKLLDACVHPDRILLYATKESLRIVQLVQKQFNHRGVDLVIINDDSNEEKIALSYRYINLGHKKLTVNSKISDELYVFIKIFKSIKEASYKHQVVNLFMKVYQNILSNNSNLRNPMLPTERVDEIIR